MQQMTTLSIPDDVGFSDLRLTRQADGSITFDWTPIKRICAASNVPVDLLREGPLHNIVSLIIRWYAAHRKAGGASDSVADSLLAEAQRD